MRKKLLVLCVCCSFLLTGCYIDLNPQEHQKTEVTSQPENDIELDEDENELEGDIYQKVLDNNAYEVGDSVDLSDTRSVTTKYKKAKKYKDFTINVGSLNYKKKQALYAYKKNKNRHYMYLFKTKKKYISFMEDTVSFNKELKVMNNKYYKASGKNPIIENIKDDELGLTNVGQTATYDCFLMGEDTNIQGVVLYQKETDIENDLAYDYRTVQLIYNTSDSTYPFMITASVPWSYKDTFTSLLEEIKGVLDVISQPTEDAYNQNNPQPTFDVNLLDQFVQERINAEKEENEEK